MPKRNHEQDASHLHVRRGEALAMLLAVLVETYSDIIVDFWKRSRLVLFSLCALLEVYGTTTFVHSNVVGTARDKRECPNGIMNRMLHIYMSEEVKRLRCCLLFL